MPWKPSTREIETLAEEAAPDSVTGKCFSTIDPMQICPCGSPKRAPNQLWKINLVSVFQLKLAIEIVDFPINGMVIFHSYVKLPEGISHIFFNHDDV